MYITKFLNIAFASFSAIFKLVKTIFTLAQEVVKGYLCLLKSCNFSAYFFIVNVNKNANFFQF